MGSPKSSVKKIILEQGKELIPWTVAWVEEGILQKLMRGTEPLSQDLVEQRTEKGEAYSEVLG